MSIIGRPLIAGSSGGSSTLITKNITANGTYNASSDNADGYSSVTVNVGSEKVVEKDVNFIDYDGTILYSYTAQEANALTALPANPSHSGLTAQGWNYTLAQMKTQIGDVGRCTIGQLYVTDDDKTRLYCHFEEDRLSPLLGICPNGTVTIDWGDGSSTNTVTGTSTLSVKTKSHVYSSAGDYVITLSAASGTTFSFYGSSTYYSYIFRKGSGSSVSKLPSSIYRNAIKKIELGSAAFMINQYAFYDCYSLSSITIHKDMVSLADHSFYNCYSLLSITLPSTVTSIGGQSFYTHYSSLSISMPSTITSIGADAFRQNYGISSIVIPYGVTTIASYAFYNCYSLSSIILPSTITSIDAYAFYGCQGLAYIIFRPTTPPTVANSYAWTNVQTDCKIYVPFSSLAAYLSASNYPSKTTYTYIGFATYNSGTTLPTQDTTQAYNVVWYASKADAIAQTNAITQGNGNEIYCRYTAV